jgi:hypothetical protein
LIDAAGFLRTCGPRRLRGNLKLFTIATQDGAAQSV